MFKLSQASKFPRTGAHPPKRNNPIALVIGRFLLRITGWKFEGEIPNLSKFIIIGGPHTSNWDAPLAVAILWVIDLDVAIMGKKEAFYPIVGPILRMLGLFPVDRQSPIGVIDQVAAKFDENEQFVLGLSPEGTRRKVDRWKTGFYRIALKADVPIFPITINFGERQIFFNPVFKPTGDMDGDITFLRTYFDAGRGRHPELG